MSYIGKGNTGPRRQVWGLGDRVSFAVVGGDFGTRGRVTVPRRDPAAAEVGYVWVQWDDGEADYCDPNSLDRG